MTEPIRTAAIVSVGTEMTLGRNVDTNSAFLSRELSRLGVAILSHATFPDDAEIFAAGLADACRRADLVVLTGGLGPTRDDLTREVAARVAGGKPLVRDPAWLALLRERYAALGRAFPASNDRQADRPEGSALVHNRLGSAPGFALRAFRALLVALPGVPREMTTMFAEEVVPLLRREGAGGRVVATRSLHLFGAPESAVGEAIEDLMDVSRNPYAAITVSGAVISIHLVATAASDDEARALLDPLDAEAARRVGPLLFGRGNDTLPSTLVRLLEGRGFRVALAESCTGGLATHLLSTVPGVSRTLLAGAVTYANAAKVRFAGVPDGLVEWKGAVSPEVARSMAEGIRRVAGAEVGLSATGVAGPDGGTEEKPVGLVYLACASPLGATVVEKHRLLGDRVWIQERAAKSLLDLGRRVLAGLPTRPVD